MVDTIDAARRSLNMSRIRGRDTQPERKLRSALHRGGLRFRLFRRDLPGHPDIVFPSQRVAIQVRGCFWHHHEGCANGRLPKSNLDYWRPKLMGNAARDMVNDGELRSLGWKVLVVWECDLTAEKGIRAVVDRVRNLVSR